MKTSTVLLLLAMCSLASLTAAAPTRPSAKHVSSRVSKRVPTKIGRLVSRHTRMRVAHRRRVAARYAHSNSSFRPSRSSRTAIKAPHQARIFRGTNAGPDIVARTVELTPVFYDEVAGEQHSACTASVVGRNWLLTAAHCLINKRGEAAVEVRVTQSGKRYKTSKMHVHTGYINQVINDPRKNVHDIALIKMSGGSSASDNLSTAFKLAKSSGEIPAGGASVRVAGHGRTYQGSQTSTTLKEGAVIRQPNDKCPVIASRGFICTEADGNEGVICGGDSGGPLFVRSGSEHTVVGVTSFSAYQHGAPDHCGADSMVEAFASVPKYYHAIKSCMDSGSCSNTFSTYDISALASPDGGAGAGSTGSGSGSGSGSDTDPGFDSDPDSDPDFDSDFDSDNDSDHTGDFDPDLGLDIGSDFSSDFGTDFGTDPDLEGTF